MIHPKRYESVGELLRDALIQYKTSDAAIEMHRRHEAERYTYADLRKLGAAFARRLEDAGVGEGDRVAILMSNQSKWLISAYAAFYRGAVIVPLDYKLTAKEQLALMAHCQPKVLVTEMSAYAKLKSTDVPLTIVSDVDEAALERAGAAPLAERSVERWEETFALAEAGHEVPTFVARKRSDDATIVYSSGTGGRPKGCVLTHRSYLSQYGALLETFPLEAGDRYFSILPTNHAIDFMCGFVGALATGATVVHQRTLRPEFIMDTMRRQKITHMAIVPLLLEAFERNIREQLESKPELAKRAVSLLTSLNGALTQRAPKRQVSKRLLAPIHNAFGGHLEALICGGAFVDPDRAQFFYDLGIPVVIGYGLTEACTAVTLNDLSPFRADSVGKPLPGVEVEVRGQGVDGVGEVWVRTEQLMDRYLDDEEQTAEVLVDGWLKTGDLGFFDASHRLKLVGRSKNMIVTAGGKNIYPEDIEGAFEGLDVDELCVFASGYVWPTTKASGASLTSERLIAVVRSKSDAFVSELRKKNRRLADFKRVSDVLIVSDEFPRTASMKVKRAALAEELRQAFELSSLLPLDDEHAISQAIVATKAAHAQNTHSDEAHATR